MSNIKRITTFAMLLLCGVIVTGCSFKLTNTVWCNAIPSEVDGTTAVVVNSVYFLKDNHVTFNTYVKKDSTLILPQTTTAMGTYTSSGTLEKGIHLDIETSDEYGLSKHTKAMINKYGLFVSDTDTTSTVYFLVSNIKLKGN